MLNDNNSEIVIEYNIILNKDNIEHTENYVDNESMNEPILSEPLLENQIIDKHKMPSIELIDNDGVDNDGGSMKTLSALITAIGNFSVQYNFQAIGIALYVMSLKECTLDDDVQCAGGSQESWVGGTSRAVIFAGAILGQLSMGYAGDLLGRTKAMILTLSIATLGALFSSATPAGSPENVYVTIIAFRFFLGIGLGGVYPLSATKAAEDGASKGDKKVDPTSAAIAFFWQAPGAMGPWLIALLYSASKNGDVNAEWRLILGLGAVPAAASVFCAIREDYLKSKMKASHVRSSIITNENTTIWHALTDKKILFKLLVTGGTWFLYDVVFYGVSVFGGKIVESIDSAEVQKNVVNNITKIAGQNLIALFMGIPATLLSIYVIKRIGTKLLQIIGFIIIGLFLFLFAGLYKYCNTHGYNNALFAVYCLLLFSLNFGPNVTTYVLPAQTYPKHIRSTCNGISAAMGKLGAVTGCYLFNIQNFVLIMVLSGFISMIGAILSLYIEDLDADDTNTLKVNIMRESDDVENIITKT